MISKPKTKIETVEADEIPEVADYLEHLELLEEYKKQHKKIFSTYNDIAEKLNQLRVEADKIVRAKNVNCGPWTVMSTAVKYDSEKLLQAVGPARFLELGGTATPRIDYAIDKTVVETQIAKKAISPELVKEIKVESIRYSAPKDV